MSNLGEFSINFLAYLTVFIIIVILVVIACILGAKLRKSKDAKLAAQAEAETLADSNN